MFRRTRVGTAIEKRGERAEEVGGETQGRDRNRSIRRNVVPGRRGTWMWIIKL